MDQVKQRTMLELVKVAKEKGDADAILEIVRYMQPLINKYSKNSYLAEYEDMQQELCLALLESIHKIKKIENEGQCVQYFANAIRNRFYEMYRSWKALKIEILGNSELLILNIVSRTRICGSFNIACAIPTRLTIPPDKFFIFLLLNFSIPT